MNSFDTDLLASFEPEKTRTMSVVDVPPKMLLELAVGIEDPIVVAERYGYYGNQWDELLKYEPFMKAVDAKRQELNASGYTFRTRANILANDLLEDVYHDAKQTGTNAHTRLEALKFMARAGGIDQPAKDEVDNSAQFSITINLSAGNSVKITGNTQKNEQKDVSDAEYYDVLPDLEQYLASPGAPSFSVTSAK